MRSILRSTNRWRPIPPNGKSRRFSHRLSTGCSILTLKACPVLKERKKVSRQSTLNVAKRKSGHMNLDTFLTELYVFVDDWYKAEGAGLLKRHAGAAVQM